MDKQAIKGWITANLLTKKEVINKYNLNPSFFDVNVTRGKIQPFIKKGINLYLIDDVEEFVNKHNQKTMNETKA